ncbi:hypothetical protein GGX14DRAFT_428939 [Mycena pura]|uniref:BTB domain-containing protein n=1 Tax=Mycena pura TaxID=153505 RepID=A0AAD6YL21_9AGAR|nr:hypothetical protein GGX14DRAFT_428939 [Mycena pura]
MTDTRTNLQGVQQHKKYFLSGGDLHVIAEDQEFRVHRYFFERESPKFRALLASPSPGQPPQGTTRLTAIKLTDVTAKEFETFIMVFYNPTYSLYEAGVGDWTCILRLGHGWQFAEVVRLAIRELEKVEMAIVDRIALYQKHDVPEEFLIAHYVALCTRGIPLDLAESSKLGMPTVVFINQAMHTVAKPHGGSASPVDSRNAEVVAKIVARIGVKPAGTSDTASGTGTSGQAANDGAKHSGVRSSSGINGHK